MNTEQQQSHLTSASGGDASKTALPGHTPGPWRASKRNPKRVVTMGKYRETDRRSIPCTVASCESEDDAARIVQCVNSHDALVEALTCAKNILYLLTPEVSALGMRSYLIHEKIAAALAKAGVTP